MLMSGLKGLMLSIFVVVGLQSVKAVKVENVSVNYFYSYMYILRFYLKNVDRCFHDYYN